MRGIRADSRYGAAASMLRGNSAARGRETAPVEHRGAVPTRTGILCRGHFDDATQLAPVLRRISGGPQVHRLDVVSAEARPLDIQAVDAEWQVTRRVSPLIVGGEG